MHARPPALLLLLIGFALRATPVALAHGFSANTVKTLRLPDGRYRIIVSYTHVGLGEYREAHVDSGDWEATRKMRDDLIGGAEFFLGDLKKTIHFHNPPEKNRPF